MSAKKIVFIAIAGLLLYSVINLPYNSNSPFSKIFLSQNRSQAADWINRNFFSKKQAQEDTKTSQLTAAASDDGFNLSATGESASIGSQKAKHLKSKRGSSLTQKTQKRKGSQEKDFEDDADKIDEDSPDKEVSIFSRRLPPATVNEPYCQYLDPLWGSAPYQWIFINGSIPKGLNLDAVNGMLCGEPKTEGVYKFQIRITDAAKEFIAINYELFVLPFSQDKPEEDALKIITDQIPAGFVGNDYFSQLLATGGKPPYEWRSAALPSGLTLDAQTGVLYGVPLRKSSESIQIVLMDQDRNQTAKNFSLVIETSPLFITTQQLAAADVGSAYFQKMTAQGGMPPYSWKVISGTIPQGLFFDTSTATFQGTPTLAQTAVLQIQVLDQENKSDIVELPLNVTGAPLKIQTTLLDAGDVGQLYYAAFSAVGGVPPYTWKLVSGTLPEGISFQPAGILTGTPQEARHKSITVEVKDQSDNKDQATLDLNIRAHALEILTTQLPDAATGAVYSLRMSAQGGTPPYTWEIVDGPLPVGLALSSDGVMSGQPQAPQTANVHLRVTDSSSNSVDKNYTLKISQATISILTNELTTATFQQSYQYQLLVEGGLPPYTWRILSGNLPGDLTLSSSGTISGLPKEMGLFPFDVEVTDSLNQTATKSLFVSVIKEPVRIITLSIPDGDVGVEFKTTLSATGGIGPYAWSISTGGLPKGLKLDTNTGKITGLPTEAGAFAVTFEAIDTLSKTDHKNFDFNIQGSALSIVTNTLKSGTVNLQYNETLAGQGGLPPYTWAIAGGTLPNGINLDSSTGNLSGTPTTAGAKTVTVQIQDQKNNLEYKQLSIDIHAQPLTFVTTDVPDGKIGVLYQFPLEVTGGTLPYRWELSSGNLPQGVQLNAQTGQVLGTPNQTTDGMSFNIKVTDQSGTSVQRNLTMKIASADLTPVKGFIARGSDKKVGLAWTNPTSPKFHHVKIIRSTVGIPQTPTDGAEIYNGAANNIVDRNLSNSTAYYYSAFAFDQLGTVSALDPDSSATATPQAVTLSGATNPFADEVVSFNPLNPNNYFGSPNLTLGAPQGGGEWAGSFDVVSLHAKVNNNSGATPPYGGSIVLRFTNNIVVNDPGIDFTVFENCFRIFGTDAYWLEPAVVDVSIDGVNYYRFAFDFVPHFNPDNKLDLNNPFSYPKGFAGIKPVFSNNLSPDPTNPSVSGGDQFDLDDLPVTLTWFQYIRITSTGDNWLIDQNGDAVRHSNEAPSWAASGSGNSGFDLDAVGAVHY